MTNFDPQTEPNSDRPANAAPSDPGRAHELGPSTTTRVELTDRVAETLAVGRPLARALVETTLDLVTEALTLGQNVKISGFGQFVVRDKAARVGRNPKTEEVVPIAPRRVVTFRASPGLKARVEQRGLGE
jgi:integration host factor subunit alpha